MQHHNNSVIKAGGDLSHASHNEKWLVQSEGTLSNSENYFDDFEIKK